MSDTSAEAFLRLVTGRRGHFRVESGHHSALWIDLDPLFADPRALEPFVRAIVGLVATHAPQVVCGPLVGGAFLAQLVARALDVEFCFTERELDASSSALYRAAYRLPRGFVRRVRGGRVALVDDIMSAGSAIVGSIAALRSAGAEPVAAGALLVMGSIGEERVRAAGVPVVAVSREPYELWLPAECPLCARGVPVEDVATGPPADAA